jgi:hypothetical protein
LHTFTWLDWSWFVKVTVAIWVRFPATIRTWAERPGRSVPTKRELGVAEIPVTNASARGSSVTVTMPSGTCRTPEQLPTGTSTRWPDTVKVKVPLTLVASERLQIWS